MYASSSSSHAPFYNNSNNTSFQSSSLVADDRDSIAYYEEPFEAYDSMRTTEQHHHRREHVATIPSEQSSSYTDAPCYNRPAAYPYNYATTVYEEQIHHEENNDFFSEYSDDDYYENNHHQNHISGQHPHQSVFPHHQSSSYVPYYSSYQHHFDEDGDYLSSSLSAHSYPPSNSSYTSHYHHMDDSLANSSPHSPLESYQSRRRLSCDEHVSTLETHLTTRPTIHRLIKSNIIKFPNISPALIPKTERLLWEQRKGELAMRMSKRPRREYLVNRLIIKDLPVQYQMEGPTPAEARKVPFTKAISHSQLSEDLLQKLDDFLKNRPRRKELVERKLIHSLQCEPYVTSMQRKMDQDRRRCSLLGALSQRPSIDQMKQRGLLMGEQ